MVTEKAEFEAFQREKAKKAAETIIETITEASEMTPDVLQRVAEALTKIMTEAEAMTEAGAMTEITIEQAAEVMTEIVSEKKQLQLQLLMM